MTTLDTLLTDDRLRAIEETRAERKPKDWHRVRLALFLALPILCGLLIARVRVGASRWTAAYRVAMRDEMNRLGAESATTTARE